MTPELKHCPFCGSENTVTRGSMYAYVVCENCGCFGPMVRPKNDNVLDADLREAERLWNDRECKCS